MAGHGGYAKTKLTVARIKQVTLLRAGLGHIAPTTMKAVIRSGIQTCIGTTIHDVQLLTGSCLICA